LAQVNGHNGFISELRDMKERVKLDVFYLKNWSFLLDLKISIKTFFILIISPISMLLDRKK
jgi:putative colanic acid biosynthesis UDP-glucose lipid carrier transferase